MSVTTTSPGVYVEEEAVRAMAIGSAATAVPVFIGKFSLKDGAAGASGTSGCIRIDNFPEFTARFDAGISVKIESVVTQPPDPQQMKDYDYTYTLARASGTGTFAIRQYFANGGGRCYVLPLATGDAKELAALPGLIERENEITLLVCAETDESLAEGNASSSDKAAIYAALNALLLNKIGYFLIADSTDGQTKPATLADKTAVYYPPLITPYTDARPASSEIAVTGYADASGSGGVATLADLEKVNPDLFAKIVADIDKQYGGDPSPVVLPPSAAVAGAYCRVDASRGVWKAPANVVLNDVRGVSETVTDAEQGTMNDAGINAVRAFTGRGVVVWGARTLVPASTPGWLYVPVRRLFGAVERDISEAMRFAVFEGNNEPTWETVRAAIDSYLYRLWKRGALVGAAPAQAYFVQVGKGTTMSEEDIKLGRMIVQIGMAPVRPAEFIILQFTQQV